MQLQAVVGGILLAPTLFAELQMRISGALLVSVVLRAACFSIAVDASAGPIQSMAFHFADDGSAAYRYVSGDLPFEAVAELTGQLVLEYDAVSGDAWISLIEGDLHSPQQTVGGDLGGADWLEGADLEVEVPGLFDGMTGVRTSPLEFAFGPRLTTDGLYRTQFVLSIDPSDLRLSGKAEFNGADGPTMFIDAPLTAVPEPTCLVAAAIGGVLLLIRVRERD
jgi:hypothetical protein